MGCWLGGECKMVSRILDKSRERFVAITIIFCLHLFKPLLGPFTCTPCFDLSISELFFWGPERSKALTSCHLESHVSLLRNRRNLWAQASLVKPCPIEPCDFTSDVSKAYYSLLYITVLGPRGSHEGILNRQTQNTQLDPTGDKMQAAWHHLVECPSLSSTSKLD